MRSPSDHAAPDRSRPVAVGAYRYLANAVSARGNRIKVPVLYLPTHAMVSQVHSELGPTPDELLRARHLASAVRDTGGSHETAARRADSEYLELPRDLVAQLAELERLTARQRALAERVGARLVQLAPLDSGYEFECLRRELADLLAASR